MTSGTRLGPYEIGSAREVPGLGEVYDARDHDLERTVAFRVLRADFVADPDRQQRFVQEARAAAELAHPNILTVHDVGTDEQTAYVVSEPIDGETLRAVLDRGALPVDTAIPYAGHIAQGLAAAHQKGIVHRDLKPENILVTPDGGVKIIGFGLAAVTQSESTFARGLSLGTLSYMSPEQVSGATVNLRSDMFAFGAIVHEMITGVRAFSGGTPIDTMTAVMESDSLPASATGIPPVLARIVDLSLKKHPASRLSAEDVVIGLRDLAPASAPADVAEVAGTPTNVGRFVRVAAVLGVLALAAGFWLMRGTGTEEMSTPTTPSTATPTPPPSTPPTSTPPASAPPVSTPPPVPEGPQLVWFDREGTELGRVGAPADYGDVSLSPDDMRVAVSVREPGSEAADIWVFDVDSGMGTRLTSDPADDIAPIWSPDGGRILFASSRSGSHDVYQRASSETGA